MNGLRPSRLAGSPAGRLFCVRPPPPRSPPVPADPDLLFRPAHELAGLVRSGELTARELVETSLERIEALNPTLNAVILVDAERALAAADAVGRDDPRPFAGVPIALKDETPAAGLRLTFGSRAWG